MTGNFSDRAFKTEYRFTLSHGNTGSYGNTGSHSREYKFTLTHGSTGSHSREYGFTHTHGNTRMENCESRLDTTEERSFELEPDPQKPQKLKQKEKYKNDGKRGYGLKEENLTQL